MFCPQCGSTQDDNLKFCKQCGANLHALRRVMASRDESDEKFDWSKTWVAEMFMSSEDAARQKAMLDRLQGKTPETRRRNEIKGGVITASAGIALMIVLFVIMNGIILSGRVSDAAIEILSRIWIVGLLPLFVGLALVFNGMFISRRERSEAGDLHRTEDGPVPEGLADRRPVLLQQPDTNPLGQDVFSVTDVTTKPLKQPTGEKRPPSN